MAVAKIDVCIVNCKLQNNLSTSIKLFSEDKNLIKIFSNRNLNILILKLNNCNYEKNQTKLLINYAFVHNGFFAIGSGSQ